MQAADRWKQAADDVLAAVVSYYAAESVELPGRQLVTPGAPAWDVDACDGMVAVQVERTFNYAGNLASQIVEPLVPAAGFAMQGATIAVHVLRCVPSMDENGNAPSAEAESAAAALILADAQLVTNALVDAVRGGQIGGCGSLAIEGWQGVGPDGGWAGGVTRLRFGV